MCNDYRLLERVPAEMLFPDLIAPEGIPNFEPREDIRITDRAPILRAATGKEPARARSNWSSAAGPGRARAASRSTISASDNRDFPKGRCVILADGFYEFTAPSGPEVEAQAQMAVHAEGS